MEKRFRGVHFRGFFTPASLVCYDFALENGEVRRVTVIIAPIRVVELNDGSLGLSYACSRGPFCRDPYCRYSKVEKQGVSVVEELAKHSRSVRQSE